MNNYEKCLKLLTSKEKFHIELGLDRVGKVLEFLGNPQDKIKTVHVAGTNGKGSTCAILSSVLKEAGYKVGLFTSPHLVKYNERIKINSLAISDNDLYNIHPFPAFIKSQKKTFPGRTTASAPQRVKPKFQGRVNAEEAEQLLFRKRSLSLYISRFPYQILHKKRKISEKS